MRPDLARIGYAKGVPMGGDLTQAPQEKAPSFLIRAVKDPDGANLDRVQVIKAAFAMRLPGRSLVAIECEENSRR